LIAAQNGKIARRSPAQLALDVNVYPIICDSSIDRRREAGNQHAYLARLNGLNG
jgi:hypothetical protein